MTGPSTFKIVPGTPQARLCTVCKTREAAACRECLRALATFPENRHLQPLELQSDGRLLPSTPLWTMTWAFACITRHPDQGTDCLLCASGRAHLCGTCLLEGALAHRRQVVGANA